MDRSLREALNYRGCLICQVLERDEADFVAQLQYQTIKDERVRQNLVSSNGYCNFHFYQVARLSSPVVNAILTKDLIEQEIGQIENGSFKPNLEIDCQVCSSVAEREEYYLQELKTLLTDKAFQKEYEGTDGLCRIHLRRILNLSKENELSRFLLATQVMHLKLLKIELETFSSKVRSTQKDMGEEKNSWWVAIEKWVGKKGLR
jgi:DNA-binding XRE family transcriptional regulator